VTRRKETEPILVTDGNFTYVSIDEQGRPQEIKQDGLVLVT
jgi:acyl-CoA thioesterase YciA